MTASQDAVTLLAILLASSDEREAFARTRDEWISAHAADPAAVTLLSEIAIEGLHQQADVLVKKRWAEVCDNAPTTCQALGSNGPALFQTFANGYWPKGHLRHLDDTLAFLEWLKGVMPHAVGGIEEATVRSHFAFRQNATIVTSSFVAQKDIGPVAGFVIVAHLGANAWHAFLPTPVPAVVARWWMRRKRAATSV